MAFDTSRQLSIFPGPPGPNDVETVDHWLLHLQRPSEIKPAVTVIYSGAGSGKTALLKHVKETLAPTHMFAIGPIDLTQYSKIKDGSQIMWEVTKRALEQVSAYTEVKLDAGQKVAFLTEEYEDTLTTEKIEEAWDYLIAALAAQKEVYRVVLLLDDFGTLPSSAATTFANDLRVLYDNERQSIKQKW